MTLEEIKSAIDSGKNVYWIDTDCPVFISNGTYCVKVRGKVLNIEWSNGKLFGKESEFFIK